MTFAMATEVALGSGFGAAGFGVEGFALGAIVGAAEGAVVGGIFTATATTGAGTDVGTAGSATSGFVSYAARVGRTFGSGEPCGNGVGFGGALGAIFESSGRAGV